MKKILFYLILALGLSSCAVQKQASETKYLTLNEIKRDYQLTNKQCRAIEKADTIESKWFQDFRVYDANEDYSVFAK